MNSNFHKVLVIFLLTALISCFGITPKAHADLIGSWTYTNHIFSGGAPAVALTPSFWFSPDPFTSFPPTIEPNLFESLIVTPDDIGVTWTTTIADDPDFTEVVSILTDDLMSRMGITVSDEFGGGVGFFSSESDLFFGFGGDPDLMPFRDFAGSTIDAFTVTLDEFFITQQGAFNVSNFTFTFSVLGTVPAPAALPLLALSALLTRRQRKRSS